MNGRYNIWNKWDPLKTVMLGDCYSANFFRDIKNDRIRSALTQIADETQEDLAYFESVLKDFGCEVIRPELDITDSIMNYIDSNGSVNGRQGVPRSPLQPRDHQNVVGNKCLITYRDHTSIKYALKKYNLIDTIDTGYELPIPESEYNVIKCDVSGDWPTYSEYLKNYNNRTFFKENVWQDLQRMSFYGLSKASSAAAFPIGNRFIINNSDQNEYISNSGFFNDFDLIFHTFDGHVDGNFHPIKPGVILSLFGVQNYTETFPNWDVCYLPDQSWKKVAGFNKLKEQVAGKWWVPGQEDNSEFTHFVETWLNDWVGYVEETVFDVNVLVLDEHHVCVNNMNPTVVEFLKKHRMEPVHIPWRHRYFWDGGLHCITLDLYRDGVQQDYFSENL